MGKDVIFVWMVEWAGVGVAVLRGDGLLDDGEAGSAAARARKTAWVLRERSVALGLARRARA